MGEPYLVSKQNVHAHKLMYLQAVKTVWISSVKCAHVIAGDSQDPRLRSLKNVLPLLHQPTARGTTATGAMLQGDRDTA